LGVHGVKLSLNGHDGTEHAHGDGGVAGRTADLTAGEITDTTAPYDLVRKMRASVLVLGPLLARMGHARVSLPGGCGIGARPVDFHIQAMEQLGAKIDLVDGYIVASAPRGLKGAEIHFPSVSVGATENALMAASLAQGTTIIENAAREPEVIDLAQCLVAMGARIEGIGTSRLVIDGQTSLHGAVHEVLPDRIEAGTYAMAAAITNGDVELLGARADDLTNVIAALAEAGVSIETTNRGLRVRRANGHLNAVRVSTAPYPGFPTDLQAQLMALMTIAEGTSTLSETIFENRFMHVPELWRMGADIKVSGDCAVVHGVTKLKGAPVMATDLRASSSLVLAGLVAEGETLVNRVYHLDRGYERLEEKLSGCGADVRRIKAAA
jgi:UDP-N-acetylglucosamine 1-carboxyvinyltransferase